MSFTIVETLEENDDQKLLSIVPHSWVATKVDANGWNQLRWPVTKRTAVLEKLQRDLNSIPANNWTYQNCKKKRVGIKSFDAALIELNIMECKSETEDEITPLPRENPKKPPTRTKNLFNTMWKSPINTSQLDFEVPLNYNDKGSPTSTNVANYHQTINDNALQEEVPMVQIHSVPSAQQLSKITQKQQLIQQHPQIIPQPPQIIPQPARPIQQTSQEMLHFNSEDYTTNTFATDLSVNLVSDDQISKIICVLDTVVENQNNMMTNQLKIIKQLSKQQATLDMMMSNISDKEVVPTSMKSSCLPSPFTTVEDLEALEIKLGNDENFQNFMDIYQHVLSYDGKCSGKTGCYKLVDKIFSRELLTKFSWSGGSRDKIVKHPFKQHDKIINAFYSIVKKVDSSFSYESCISFFQTVIRNATRRIENDPKKKKIVISRASSGRKRAPKTKTKATVENTAGESIDINNNDDADIHYVNDDNDNSDSCPVSMGKDVLSN